MDEQNERHQMIVVQDVENEDSTLSIEFDNDAVYLVSDEQEFRLSHNLFTGLAEVGAIIIETLQAVDPAAFTDEQMDA